MSEKKTCNGCVYHWPDGTCGVQWDHPQTRYACEHYETSFMKGEVRPVFDKNGRYIGQKVES